MSRGDQKNTVSTQLIHSNKLLLMAMTSLARQSKILTDEIELSFCLNAFVNNKAQIHTVDCGETL